MDESTYLWKRYWCSREGKYLLTDEGYLHDPESNYLMEEYPDVVSFQSISKNHCLILLGEPGIGKTSAMNEEAEDIDSGIEASGGQTLRIDLNSISDISGLSKLFDNDAIQNWIKGEYSLHIFLDSLDECLLYIKNLVTILLNQLKSFPKDRLYLRIACRTADWQRLQILEIELKKLWDKDTIGVFELLPLTKRDVYNAAKTRGYDSEIFLRMIMDRDAGPLASRPVTLKFLLDTYAHIPHVSHPI
jgi:predicted NACHT family NTPase